MNIPVGNFLRELWASGCFVIEYVMCYMFQKNGCIGLAIMTVVLGDK